MNPPPGLVFVLGFVVHAAHHPKSLAWYVDDESAFAVAAQIFSAFTMPVHFVFGHHDSEINCTNDQKLYPRELSHRLFAHFFQAKPYYSVEHKGWQF